jgi:hypothetical protein
MAHTLSVTVTFTNVQRLVFEAIGDHGDKAKAALGLPGSHMSNETIRRMQAFAGLRIQGLVRVAMAKRVNRRSYQVWRLTEIGRQVFEQIMGRPAQATENVEESDVKE